jgi:hypothetical protein
MQVEDSAAEPLPILVEDLPEELEIAHSCFADHISYYRQVRSIKPGTKHACSGSAS